MGEDNVNMSLEDLIKSKPSLVKRGGGKSRGGGGGGGSRGGRGNRRGSNFRSNPYSRDTPTGRWQHDKFEGGSRSGGGRRSFGGDEGNFSKLLISNLEYSVNDQDIKELFSEFGPLKSSSVHYDRSGRSLGTADVTYLRKTDATRALKTYNDVPLDGKPMRIELVAEEGPLSGRTGFRSGNSGGSSRGRGNRNNSRGGGGRGGRGRGREQKKPMTAEELDAQLDEYKKKA